MKNFRIILLLLFSSISFQSIAQSDEEVQPTNMDKLLEAYPYWLAEPLHHFELYFEMRLMRKEVIKLF